MPASERRYHGYYHASPECWSLYEEVLAAEIGNGVLFGQVHSLTVDAYAAQHAGGPHPDKSVCVHLVGLCLVMERGLAPIDVAPRLQRLASTVRAWPHFTPPADRGPLTVFDVAGASSPREHADRVHAWAAQVWSSWSAHHRPLLELTRGCFAPDD